MLPKNTVSQESDAEIRRVQGVAEALGLKFDEVIRAGSQGNVIGVQSESLLFSHRLDSRTFFVQDSRYGPASEGGMLEASDEEYLHQAHELAEKLRIPTSEFAEQKVLKEQNQSATVDRQSGHVKFEEPGRGKVYASISRHIEGLPVWSSRVILGLTKERGIGFLEAHWPEISATTLEEARRLAERVKGGWKPPEHPGSKPNLIEAGIIHSPAAGFVMDIFPVIRVIYASNDPTFNKQPVLYFDRHGNTVPIPRQFEMDPQPSPEKRPAGADLVPPHRKQFRELLLTNPNYFGNLKGNPFPSKINLQFDTTFEELGCVGYQPQFRKLEAVVYIKQNGGYGGSPCSDGTPEYVRFYLSYDMGATWQDHGMTRFTAFDIPFEGRLEYAVTLQINPRADFCFNENLPLVRAILSWNNPPPPNTPDFPPVWGNVHQAHIQIDGFQLILLDKLFAEAKVSLPASITAIVDPKQEIALAKKPPLTALERFNLYKGTEVPPHRFLHKEITSFSSKPWLTTSDTSTFAGITVAENLDLSAIIGQLFSTNGDTTFEELTCIGLDPNESKLNGIVRVKLPNGYSGGLCGAGSQEYVAFWVDYGDGWTYAGTTSVNVHDIAGTPHDGLYYAVSLPIDLRAHQKPCDQGPVQPNVRAILSWDFAPPPGNPDFIPTWGNRLETLIEIPSGPVVDGQVPLLSSVGDMYYTRIDATGKANGTTIHTGLLCSDSPFGGRVTMAGHISNATPGLKYRLMRSLHGAGAYTPLTIEPTGLEIALNTWNSITGWTQTTVTNHADVDGYYPFEDYSSNHSVEGNILMVWYSTAADDGITYDFRIDLSIDGNPAHDSHSNVVTVLIDNTPPDASLLITLMGGVQCADFAPGATFNGTFTATDAHFGGFSFELEPSGPPNNPTHGVLPVPPGGTSVYFGGSIADPGVGAGNYTLNTGMNVGPPATGPMDPCGYALMLHAYDRTNVNSGGGYNTAQRSVGFCLQTQSVK